MQRNTDNRSATRRVRVWTTEEFCGCSRSNSLGQGLLLGRRQLRREGIAWRLGSKEKKGGKWWKVRVLQNKETYQPLPHRSQSIKEISFHLSIQEGTLKLSILVSHQSPSPVTDRPEKFNTLLNRQMRRNFYTKTL